MSTGKQLHQATQGMVLFVERQAQEHSAPSSGIYSAVCQALASSTCRSSPWYRYRTDRTLLGAEERWFVGSNSLPS